jgi:hypothetical protein
VTVTYGNLLTRAAGSVHDGATQIQHRPFDTHAEALRALADFHGVLDALQAYVWALIRPGRAAGITSSLHPEPSEITALTLSQAIADVTGAVRPHPSLLCPAVDPWARAAQLVRAAGDLLETHRAPDGTPRSPDADILDTAAGRATCLARVGDLAGAVLAMEDTLALRAGQAHVTWPEVRRWLPGLAHLRRHAQTLAAAGDLHATARLDDLALIGTPIRTDDVVVELADRLTRLRQTTWQLVGRPDRSVATLEDIATAGVAVHAHAAAFHGANVTTTTTTPVPEGDLRRLVERGHAWQELRRHLHPLASPAPRDDVVREDLIAITRALRAIAPLAPTTTPRASELDPHTRRVGAALNGAVTLMADVGDHGAQAFRRITRTSTLYLPARSLTGDQITDRPDLAKAHLADKLTLAPQPHLDAVAHLFQAVRAHPVPTPTPPPSPVSAIETAFASREPITRHQVQDRP